MSASAILGCFCLVWAVAGIGYCVQASVAIRRFSRRPSPPSASAEPVSLLKPLYGAEPRLDENLATFLDQDWAAPIQMVAGIQNPADPALAVARTLTASEGHDVTLVVDATRRGANAKVANLINMAPAATHDLIVLSDSDMAVPRDYLARVAAALAAPGVGAVTCLYRGRGDAGFWSVLGAASVSYNFLPNVLVSLSLGDARVCMGSTIALRRETLDAIGGFGAFADILADDHAIGAAVRARGEKVAIPRLVLTHAATERSFGELLRHELRWAATVREVVSIGEYAGLAFTHPVVPALAACLLLPNAGAIVLAGALFARATLWRKIDRFAGVASAPLWMLPLRDLMSFAVFVASLGIRSVDWRGEQLRITEKGRISSRTEPIS